MPVLAAFTLAAAGIAVSGLGDTALLGPASWFVPGMGAFAAACYITALAREDRERGLAPVLIVRGIQFAVCSRKVRTCPRSRSVPLCRVK